MIFIVKEEFRNEPPPTEDTVLLIQDNWDDYGYRTTFTLYFAPSEGQYRLIGAIKILAKDYKTENLRKETIKTIPSRFTQLPLEDFCSLGQSNDYYRRLGETPNIGKVILTALNDIAFVEIDWATTKTPGFETSLLRSADQIQNHAQEVFSNAESKKLPRANIDFNPSKHGHAGLNHINLKFDTTQEIGGRLNVLVGKNGSGKTTLLTSIIKYLDPNKRSIPEFSRVTHISYNPYDNSLNSLNKKDIRRTRFIGRTPLEGRAKGIMNTLNELQSIEEKSAYIWKAPQSDNNKPEKPTDKDLNPSSKNEDRWIDHHSKTIQHLLEIIENLSPFPEGNKRLLSLQNDEEWSTFLQSAFNDDDACKAILETPDLVDIYLSSGQQVLAQLYASLFIEVDMNALVLIDEPENHLHPSLLAQFIKNFNVLLEQRHAFGIIATHSPIIVQETPSKHVTILRRDEEPSHPSFETFGESIDQITETLFDTDFSSSNWKSILNEYSQTHTIQEVEKLLSTKQLSLQARSYYHYIRHQVNNND